MLWVVSDVSEYASSRGVASFVWLVSMVTCFDVCLFMCWLLASLLFVHLLKSLKSSLFRCVCLDDVLVDVC